MTRRRLLRLLFVVSVCVLSWPVDPARMEQSGDRGGADTFRARHLPFFAENCYACHNGKKSAAGLNLERYTDQASILADRETWEKVLARMVAGEMPPKGLPRPDEAAMSAVVNWLTEEFARIDRVQKPDPGRVTARRLNRSEYNNTVRDLLGVDIRPAEDFPQDDSGYGFDTIGDVLSLPPVLMEKYLAAAEKVTQAALFGPEMMKPSLARPASPPRNIVPSTTPLFDYDKTGLSLHNALHLTYRFPVEAEYVLRIFLAGERPLSSEPITLALWIDGQKVQTLVYDPEGKASFDNDRQELSSLAVEMRQRFDGGEHWVALSIMNLYDGLPESYGGPNPSRRPVTPYPDFRPPRMATPERVAELRKEYEIRRAQKRAINMARISRLEIGGPYDQKSGVSIESRRLVYTCGHLDGHHVEGCERRIIANLARRAYRRPVTPEETARLRRLFVISRERGASFEESIAVAIQAMLVSPNFLFRIERERAAGSPDAANGAATSFQTLNQYELASRLSYFLWSSMPDEELIRLADRRQLRQPAVLEAQVRRMIANPKSHSLIENFGGQWLELRRLESIKPDTQRFPAYDEYLRLSMRRETELFLENIIREDRPLTELIDANYTYLNERLARFYQIPDVIGPEFRKVKLKDLSQRGGILTQASVLTVSSYATRTSPVLRGKWILENVLNAPPPAPPPGVPPLDEETAGAPSSLRQRLELHRRNPTCASCHSKMDPLGFGLENFDAIGAWRTTDGKIPIDSSGTLPNGKSFNGPRELKAIVMDKRENFTEGVTEKMLIYALGRGLERYDRPAIRTIASRTVTHDFKPSTMILEIVRSLPFQNRRRS